MDDSSVILGGNFTNAGPLTDSDRLTRWTWDAPQGSDDDTFTGSSISLSGEGFIGVAATGAVTLDDSNSAATFDDTHITYTVDDSSTITIKGLTSVPNGTYKVLLDGVGGQGEIATLVVNASTAPSAPQTPAASAGNSSATVTWTAPASPGTGTITGYTVTASGGGGQTCSATAPVTSCLVSGLTNGTSYTFSITATNSVPLTGPAATTNAVTPIAPDPTPPDTYPPSEPLNVTGLAGDASAVVSWSRPASAGSFAITDYQAVVSPGGQSCTVAAPALSCMITGLTNGTSYTATARALNGAGWGPFSAASPAFTPEDPTPPVEKSIVITGSRTEIDGRSGVRALGETTGLAGQVVQARVHLSGEVDYYDGSRRTIGTEGSFTWQRKTNKKVYLYFRAVDDGVRSNRIVINIR